MRKVSKWIKALIVTLIVTSGIVSAYIYKTVSDISLSIFHKQELSIKKSMKAKQEILLEEGSLVNKKELGAFLLFSQEAGSPKSVLEKLKATNYLKVIDKKNYLLEKNTSILPLLKNNCQAVYCYQSRINFSYIPSIFWKGLIGIEDYRFLEHKGVDPRSIIRAAIHDIRVMKFEQGGSTLTQQLVKNLFYTNDKTIIRKLKEVIVAIYLEAKLSKEEIIEAYFNEVFWGSLQGIRIKGLFAATAFYFSKKPSEVDPYEAAILISFLKGPNYYNPFSRLPRLKARTELVYKKLISMNLFPKDKKYKWSDNQWINWVKKLKKANLNRHYHNIWIATKDVSDYFSEYEKFVFINKAKTLERSIKKQYKDKNFGVKFITKNFQSNKTFSFYSKFERLKESAITKEKHLLGSVLKPILFSIFTDLGIKMSDEIETAEIKLDLKSGPWSPRESHFVKEDSVQLSDALKQSLNRPVIRIAQNLGFDKVENSLLQYLPYLKKPLSEYPAQLLGAVELSLSEILEVYTKFIKAECLKSYDEENILKILSDPNQTTIKRAVKFGIERMEFFGKTGTSNNGNDSWFVFFDGMELGVIWFGVDGKRDQQKLNLYGSSTAFKLYQQYLNSRGRQFHELSCDFAKGK